METNRTSVETRPFSLQTLQVFNYLQLHSLALRVIALHTIARTN